MHRALVVGLLTAVSAVTYRLAELIHGVWSAVTFGFAVLVGAAAAFLAALQKTLLYPRVPGSEEVLLVPCR